MSWETKIEALDPGRAKKALTDFLIQFTTPAFGALPKREVELAVFNLLTELGLVSNDASIYELMTDLRITRSKASTLLFDRDVRHLRADPTRLDAAVQKALTETRFVKDGDYFVLEVENPLVLAHLKHKLRSLHHLSDSSFNASLVRMTSDAAADLIADLLSDEQKITVRNALIAAGAPDASLKGVLKSSLKKLGSKILGDVTDSLVENASDYLTPLFNGAAGAITSKWKSLA